MPDFTYETMQQCKDISRISIKIDDYIVSRIQDFMFNHCTCKGFKFRRNCKHLDIAQNEICTWHQMTGMPQDFDEKESMICPMCSGETEYVRVAV